MNASTTALLVLDLQPVTLGMLKDDELAKKVLDNNKKLIEAARSKNILIAFVRVAFNNEEFQNIPSTNKSFSRFAQMGIKTPSQLGFGHEDASAQIHPELGGVKSNDIQIRKIRPGAFTNTNLHQQLQKRKIEYLFISGVSTSNAVLTAVRNAMDLDYGITVVTDACADPDAELHKVLINSFERASDLLTTEETIQKFSTLI